MTAASGKDLVEAIAAQPTRSALLVDYDGTLTPIVEDPDDAVLGEAELDLLHRLSELLGTLAVVSGRPGTFLRTRLGYGPGRRTRLLAFGRAGLDSIDPSGALAEQRDFDRYLPLISALATEARALAPEALVEEKGVIVTLHWRRAPGRAGELVTFATRRAADHGLALRPGRQSIELFPPGLPTKGTVVGSFAQEASVLAYAGDDAGDLEAFDALDECAGRCQTIRVGVASAEAPPELIARADLILGSPEETIELLEDLERALAR